VKHTTGIECLRWGTRWGTPLYAKARDR